MQIQQAKYFVELANAGSFYAAAPRCFLSSQGLNKAITALEAEMDVTLIERNRRGVRLTRDGELFLTYAEKVVNDYDEFTQSLFTQRQLDESNEAPTSVYVSYYAAQVASTNPDYVRLLTNNLAYVEEPFDKLLQLAATSDGSDLIFVDLYGDSLKKTLANPDVQFEPIITSRAGFVWKEGSALAQETLLHRKQVHTLPVAINTHKDQERFADFIFTEYPLQDIRMGASNPRMLLEYARCADHAVSFFDAFGFYLSQKDRFMPTDGLGFTPFSTPKATLQIGFLYPKHATMTLRARYIVSVLKRYLQDNGSDYFEQYPTRL